MNIKDKEHYSFLESLNVILEKSKESPSIKLKTIFQALSGRGYAALLVIFSLPFCLPIQIPGFSTPFGLLLAFLGLRIAFAQKLWWPSWVLEKEIPSVHVEKWVQGGSKVVKYLQNLIQPRLLFFTESVIFDRFNGVLIFFLALLLALPLPIPFTNLLSAIPILLIGLGLLEDDGIVLLLGYVLGLLGITFFVLLFIFSKHQVENLIQAFTL